MLKRAAQQRWLAWLALAGMSLLVLMPVLSRSLMPAGMPADCSMSMHMHMAMSHGMPHGSPQQPDDPTASCAYCVLLAHSPLLDASLPQLLSLPPMPALAPLRLQPAPVASLSLLSARPRGPPVSIV